MILGFLFFSSQLLAEQSYYSGSFARLSYVQGDVRIDRGQELGIESGEVNYVLTAGDRVITEEGLAELSFGKNNYLRIDRYAYVEIVRLPESGYDDVCIHLHYGRFYLRVSRLEWEKSFSLHTPDASFYILEEGLYRLEVDESGHSEVMVMEGRLEAAGREKSLILRSGESAVAEDGYLEEAGSFLLTDDDFEGWNQRRENLLSPASYDSGNYLPEEIREYEPELSSNGRWVYERPYGYVWVPAVTYVDWRPYLYGRWVWYPRIGWTWVSAEPWGWAVYHYGRWHWRLGLGWYWIPTVHWGPAWVHWYWDADIVAWCPLSYWNRPVVIINNYFYDRYHDPYYPLHSRALIIVRKHQMQAPHRARVLVRPEQQRGMEKIKLEARQPQIKPAVNTSLRVPGLKASPAIIQEWNPAGLKQISSSRIQPGQRSDTDRKPGAVSSSRLRRLVSPENDGSKQGRLVKPDLPSSDNSNFRFRVTPEKTPPSSVDRNKPARPGPDENGSKLRNGEGRKDEVIVRQPSRPNPTAGSTRLRTADNRGNSVEKYGVYQPRQQVNKNTINITERPVSDFSSRYRPENSSGQGQKLQNQSSVNSHRFTEQNRGSGPLPSGNSGPGYRPQTQERKSSYNLPSLSRPYNSSSISSSGKSGNAEKQSQAAGSLAPVTKSRPPQNQPSSSSGSRQSSRKKNS